MKPCLALLKDPGRRDRLSRALARDLGPRRRAAVAFCGSAAELLAGAHRSPPVLVIFGVPPCGAANAPGLATELRKSLPRAPLVCWTDRTMDPRAAFALARAGVDALVVGSPPIWDVQRAVGEALAHSVARDVLPTLKRLAPAALAPFLEALVAPTAAPLRPEDAARLRIGDVSTLRRDLVKAGFPPVNKLIVWYRLFHAARLLENPHRSVENVALVLGFPSRCALTNHFRRYAGIDPRALRQGGGIQDLLGVFEARHRRGEWACYPVCRAGSRPAE